MRRIILSLFSLTLLVAACNGGKNKANSTNAVNVQDQSEDYLKVITIKSGQKVVIDNPQTFIEIGILFNHAQKQWTLDLQQNTNLIQEEYQDKKREEFYKSFGITESDVAVYNQNHYNEIEEFLANNEAFREAYHASAYSEYDENY